VGTTPEPSDAVAGTGADTAVGAEPPVGSIPPEAARRFAEPSILDRVRGALGHTTARQVVGWVLVVGWLVWLVALWVTQPRLVSQDFMAAELANERVAAYQVVTVDVNDDGMFSGRERIAVQPESDLNDGVVDDAVDGQPLTVAYWVDAPVASLRVLDPNALGSDTATTLVQRFAAAGVPEAEAADLWFRPGAERTDTGGGLLVGLTLLMVLIGPRPSRGTRWFWFWLLAAPLGLAVPLFAVAERLRPRYWPEGTVHPKGVAGRWSGLTGFAVGVLLSVVVSGLLLTLTDISPIWFIRG
jgi:hypothetical protein